MVKFFLTYCFVFVLQITFAQDYVVKQLDVVGNPEVYSPVYFQNKIVVCSNKKDEIFYTIKDASQKKTINLFVLNQYKNDTLILKPFDKTFKTKLNDGPITFNKDFNQCFISQNVDHLSKADNKLMLVEYVLKEDKWIKDSSFTYNNPAFSLTHPALSEDGNTLIFSSNMPGGFGGFDLWKSVKVKGVWSKPINLGSNINSLKNEFFPTLINQELYFSSDRAGYGGLDIYKSNLKDNHPPTLLPLPINSQFDDFSIIANSLLDKGYFSSNRNGQDQIWSFKFNYPEFNNCDSIVDNNFCYTLYEETAVAIPNQKALLYKWTINGEKRQGVEIRYCFPGPGDYEIILDVEDTIAHINYDEQSHLNITLEDVMKPYISSLDTVQVNTLFYLGSEQSNLPYMTNKKYFWSIENKKMVGEQISHSFKQAGKYQVQLGIEGYEDTTKVSDCVYKTIVCIDKNIVQNLNKDFTIWKSQMGEVYQVTNKKNEIKNIGETFTLSSLTYDQNTITSKEKQDLNYLVEFLLKHPNTNLTLSYYLDANQPNYKLKEKVLNILKYLILSGIDNNRVSLIEKIAVFNEKPNSIEFNYHIYEKN